MQNRVVWRIKRKNPLRGLTCGCVEEKKAYIKKNFCIYFTHLPRSPSWRNLHKILHDGYPRRRNQPCQILSQSGQGFWFCGRLNFWIPHRNEKSPLTQGLNYRSACDSFESTEFLYPTAFLRQFKKVYAVSSLAMVHYLGLHVSVGPVGILLELAKNQWYMATCFIRLE